MRIYNILTLDEIVKQEHNEPKQIVRDVIGILNNKKPQYIRLLENWDLRWENGDLESERFKNSTKDTLKNEFNLLLANALWRGIPVILSLSNLKIITTLITIFDSCTVLIKVEVPCYTLSFKLH